MMGTNNQDNLTFTVLWFVVWNFPFPTFLVGNFIQLMI